MARKYIPKKKMNKEQFAFYSSQRAHKKYGDKYEKLQKQDPKNYDRYFVKSAYHGHCYLLQEKRKKKLTQKEKEQAYRDVITDFY